MFSLTEPTGKVDLKYMVMKLRWGQRHQTKRIC